MLKSTWSGGKPAGTINYRDTDCQLTIKKDKVVVFTKSFTYSNYKTKDEAIKAATECKLEKSKEFGLTKNQYRLVLSENPEEKSYVEVKLQDDHIMLCEIEHMPYVINSTWTARTNGRQAKNGDAWYVQRATSKKLNQERIFFHNLVYPELHEIDHINRNDLDNRKSNIRDGSNRVNANNKREFYANNTSGIPGVTFRENKNGGRWIAKWVNEEGKNQIKSFSVATFGEKAKQMACDYRNEQRYKPEFPPSLQELQNLGQYTPSASPIPDIDFGEIEYEGVPHKCDYVNGAILLCEIA